MSSTTKFDDPSTSPNKDEALIIKTFSEIIQRALQSSFGESASKAIIFILKEALKEDPCEAFWRNPRTVYSTMIDVFGNGTKVLINALIADISRRCGVEMRPEHLIKLIESGDQSSIEEIRSIIRKICQLYGGERM